MSTSFSIASLCKNTYSGFGIRPTVTSAHDAASIPTANCNFFPACSVHELKFITSRALSTSFAISHETGATWAYHGHFVSFEWQFQQERCRILSISSGTSTWFRNAADGAATGFVRGKTGTACNTTNSPNPTIAAHRKAFFMLSKMLLHTGAIRN